MSSTDAPEDEKKKDAPETVTVKDAPEIKVTTFLAPAAMLGIKYFGIDLTEYRDNLRIAFGVVVLLKFIVIFFIYMKSQQSIDLKPVVVTEKGSDGKETKKTMTVKEYDASQAIKSAGQALFALCITCGIHYKWGNPTPLFFQCLMGPIGMLDDSLFRIHVLGSKAEGKLERPFKPAPSPFQDLIGGGAEPQAEEATSETKVAERKRGKKEKKSD
mmetsp:Transcript_66328/g.130025  ORF Transcript_66328/g.130025 Transcript_66328/m.130025 type:complete len:215 (+) Transcript_66328:59-703(+)|eukprot:CAMPEP_0171629502 /NCGR_PEP_ID=MMETSP0990-20121206/22223_1 /TAXON_ID=483369 /ORGANISM="non described non described, Strain CCMP2098" /LENGTH=214 /DNA_ID=CAMNT_0012198195 /DNA_START=68 /DNA_END=712 /DNA_ORIENTATION=-